MTTEQRRAWLEFRGIHFHADAGVPSVQFHQDTRVFGRRDAQVLAKEAFEIGIELGRQAAQKGAHG